MPLLRWSSTNNKYGPFEVDPKAAKAPTAMNGMYCPQNCWGTLTVGTVMIGFAHVMEGKDGQLAGLEEMLETIKAHKADEPEKVNVFACGSVMPTPAAKTFRTKIAKVVSKVGLPNSDALYDDRVKCLAWVATLEPPKQPKIVLGTAGITSCIGVLAWAPNTIACEIEYIADASVLGDITLRMGNDAKLEKVDLKKFRVSKKVD